MSENNLIYSRGCKIVCDQEGHCSECCGVKHAAKLDAWNWLKDMDSTKQYVEVRFKNTRKGYYLHNNEINQLSEGDIVVVEAVPGYDIGVVLLTGELVTKQMLRYRINPSQYEFKKIYRKAKPQDVEKWHNTILLEHDVMIKTRKICDKLKLQMKIADIEYQADGSKAIFYYIAEERVDFRELIIILAQEFKIRVEMKQIGVRQEAGRVGGIGSCGREMCCAKWLNAFSTVTTTNAKVQDLSLNQQKLAGQCGKLKCCLNFEYAVYLDAQKGFPKTNIALQTVDGDAYHFKTDTHRKLMWYGFDRNAMTNLTAIPVDRVNEIISLNQKGIKVTSLIEQDAINIKPTNDFQNAAGSESITRFDKRKKNRKNRK